MQLPEVKTSIETSKTWFSAVCLYSALMLITESDRSVERERRDAFLARSWREHGNASHANFDRTLRACSSCRNRKDSSRNNTCALTAEQLPSWRPTEPSHWQNGTCSATWRHTSTATCYFRCSTTAKSRWKSSERSLSYSRIPTWWILWQISTPI